ncbi:uncharacterized protein PAC_16873 [Phialocephala subalpina]|uniref:Uncharacterized protein n=1 Tax=Phialocephala subalpina TaxID=576137 RepID=A0A1L7XPL8_9HELO|nr:uncharacterized protein PAC_16873 [Phialocephala subalpina]
MAENTVDTDSAAAREYLLAQNPEHQFRTYRAKKGFPQSIVSGLELSDTVEADMLDLPNDAPTKTFDPPPRPPPPPLYESGSFAWTKPKQADGPPTRIVGGTQKGEVVEDAAYDHPCIILKRIDSTREGEEEKYLAVSVTSFSNMKPGKWLKKRLKIKTIRHTIPIDHPNSPFEWPGLRAQVREKTKKKKKEKKLKKGLNPAVTAKGARLPVLYLNSECSSMDRWKQNYAKLDAILEIPACQLRHFESKVPRDAQLRLCYDSFRALMAVLGFRQRKHNVLAGTELSLLYYGPSETLKWPPAFIDDDSTVIGERKSVFWEEDEASLELVGPSSGARPMDTRMSGTPLGTQDANLHQAGNIGDHDMLNDDVEKDPSPPSQHNQNKNRTVSPNFPPVTKPPKDARHPMKLPGEYKDWWTYVRNHTDINNYDPYPSASGTPRWTPGERLGTMPPTTKGDDADTVMEDTQQKQTSVLGSKKRAIETDESTDTSRKRQKLDISPFSTNNNEDEDEDLMTGPEMRATIWARKLIRRVEMGKITDVASKKRRLFTEEEVVGDEQKISGLSGQQRHFEKDRLADATRKLFDPMGDFRLQNISVVSKQNRVVETDENEDDDVVRKKRRLFYAKELKEAAQLQRTVGFGGQKQHIEADEDADAARKRLRLL